MPTRYRGVVREAPGEPGGVVRYDPEPTFGVGVYLAQEVDAVLEQKNEEIGALQEQLAAEKIAGGRLRGELTKAEGVLYYWKVLSLPITGIFHADALDPDERVELAEDRPEFYLFERKEDASFLYHYSKKRPEQLPWVPKKVTLYAPATLAEPPYPWKRVVRGSRDEEIHRKAGWVDLAEMLTEPVQIPLSQSVDRPTAGSPAWTLEALEERLASLERGEGPCPNRCIPWSRGIELRLHNAEEITAQLLTTGDGVDVRLDMLDEDVEREKNERQGLDRRIEALAASLGDLRERLLALESQSKHQP